MMTLTFASIKNVEITTDCPKCKRPTGTDCGDVTPENIKSACGFWCNNCKEEFRKPIDWVIELSKAIATKKESIIANSSVIGLEAENTKLRGIIAQSDLPCLYCNLSKADMTKCKSGFPGCGRADDLMLDDAG